MQPAAVHTEGSVIDESSYLAMDNESFIEDAILCGPGTHLNQDDPGLRRMVPEVQPHQAPDQGPNRCETPESKFLEMPVDGVFLILDNLSLPDKLVLAQTCASFRRIVGSALHKDASRGLMLHVRPGEPLSKVMTKEEQLQYLFNITHDRMDSWVCHPVKVV